MSTIIPVSVFAFLVKDQNGNDLLQTRVSPEIVDLPSLPVTGPVTIRFQIQSTGYFFDTVGIAIVSPDHENQFGPVWYSQDRTAAQIENQNYTGLAYAYMVYVTDMAKRLKASVDPVVQNDTR
jgi:hypothetical protein